jgi:hypothetical protein
VRPSLNRRLGRSGHRHLTAGTVVTMSAPSPSPRDQMRALIASTEHRLAESFEKDAGPELALVDAATALLAVVMAAVGPRTTTITLDDHDTPVGGETDLLRLYALQVMGVRALRVIRAARATLAHGYETEARAQDRILVELVEHRSAVLDDSTGAKARAGLAAGKARARDRCTGRCDDRYGALHEPQSRLSRRPRAGWAPARCRASGDQNRAATHGGHASLAANARRVCPRPGSHRRQVCRSSTPRPGWPRRRYRRRHRPTAG